MSKEIRFKMQNGQTANIKVQQSTIFVTGVGRNTYLWVGNDSKTSKACFATMSGPKTLERFAINILKSIGSKRLKK